MPLLKILSLVKRSFILLIVVAAFVWIFVINFSFVFKSKIVGEVQAVEHVGAQTVITNNQPMNPQVFSFSVAIKDIRTNEIHMASSEDRQWGAVTKGNCVVAAVFPYEPWKITKAMTGRNARLLQNYISCADLPKSDGWFEAIRFFFLWY